MRHTRLMIIAALAALCADAGLAQPGKTVRLLTVGNSFSENATTYLPELVKAGGNPLMIMGHADLAGCVWYEFLFGQNVENNSYIPAEITPADARLLRHIAHKTVHAE